MCQAQLSTSRAYSRLVAAPLLLLQVVLEVLLSAAAAGRRFHVVVLDSRPELEGRQMLKRLLQVSAVAGGGVAACCRYRPARKTTNELFAECQESPWSQQE